MDIEIEAYHSQGVRNIIKIIHPLKQYGNEVFKFLYGNFTNTKTMLLLPSNGFTNKMIQDGWKAGNLSKHIASKWNEAICTLLEFYPNYTVKMKLHPSCGNDPFWRKITELIKSSYQKLELIPFDQSAEWHIVQSKVIVGDVTSSLWWASLYGGKTVISLDIFGYKGGDEMKSYIPYILYVNKLADLSTLDSEIINYSESKDSINDII